MEFQVNTTITRLNRGSLMNIYRIVRDLGALEFHPFFYVPTGRGKDIMAELGQKLYISRTQDGAGSTQYQSLHDLYEFYKALSGTFEEEASEDSGTSTGRYLRMRKPCIGGGM